MSRNLYIAAIEPLSGKSVIALGMMELLSRRIRRVGFFRPIIPDTGGGNTIRLLISRYHLAFDFEELYGFRHAQAQEMHAKGDSEQLLKSILDKYKALEQRCDFVLCEGTDYTGVSSAFEFDFNAQVANNLASPLLTVVNGRGKSAREVVEALGVARESYLEKGCTLAATVANRVDPAGVSEIVDRLQSGSGAREPVYVLPEEPALGKPTMGEIAGALKGEILQGDSEGLQREVRAFRVAAMNLPNFLDYVADGTLVITPGDRADVILGSLASAVSETYPNICGLLLTGGLRVEPQVLKLVEGFKRKLAPPIVSVATDTYTTAMNVSRLRAAIAPGNDRKIASALGLFETHVDAAELIRQIKVVRSTRVTPIMFEYELVARAKACRRHIVLPEGTEERILRAAEILLRRGVAQLTLLGESNAVMTRARKLGLSLADVEIIDPLTAPQLETYARQYYEMRRHKGISEQMARDTLTDISYFGTMMVYTGAADGMVSGSVHTTAHTIRPALQIIRARPGISVVSSVFLMCLADRVLVYGDCAVNPDPNAEQLADIAVSSAETARIYGIEPRIAMCSYSTGESGRGKDVDKVRRATHIVRRRRPDLAVEGPIQYDAAVDAGVARTKMPGSKVAGHATVFIFPDLNTGNNLYKAVQRSAHAVAIGPVLQGLKKPVNDLSRGCTVTDIVNTVAITAIQAQAAADDCRQTGTAVH